MNLKMPGALKQAYLLELENYKSALTAGNPTQAWHFLERAHVLGQYHPVPHTSVHFRMLVFSLQRANFGEAAGQLLRLLVGWIGSLVNRVPVGNTGGANIPIMARMPIPDDLRRLLPNAEIEKEGLAGLRRSDSL